MMNKQRSSYMIFIAATIFCIASYYVHAKRVGVRLNIRRTLLDNQFTLSKAVFELIEDRGVQPPLNEPVYTFAKNAGATDLLGNEYTDPWGNPYYCNRDDLYTFRIWSFGENGINEQGRSDDIVLFPFDYMVENLKDGELTYKSNCLRR